MGAYVEPDLQNVGNRNTVADDHGAEDGFPEGGNAHINIRFLFSAFRGESDPVEDLPVQAFEVEVRRNAVHETESQRFGCGEQAETGARHRLVPYVGLYAIGLKRR